MIIMINGAFGVGKTTVANALHKDLESSMLFDPEEVGFMLRNIIPEDIQQTEANTGDFQDLELWKELTVKVAEHLLAKYQMNLIVPMTIRNPDYFQYIFNGFQSIDPQTFHFCLTASKATIHKRLRGRGEKEGNWSFEQTDKCLKAFEEYNFKEYIDTEHATVDMMTKNIIDRLYKILY
ncbi:AAA family ATPase [Salinibacillus xinjiangensis]|uniref:AAA family ATPase n=1 Tax=Salinibacillus xinjiangensis TaxID=1229268 RepID=A0A6G1X501_9BACI|nr:AAA family ATPase [Salinibacillus xinjiangensis]MRG85908.1 AAA family ATPase [Salinibacillus xinjiangensis]